MTSIVSPDMMPNNYQQRRIMPSRPTNTKPTKVKHKKTKHQTAESLALKQRDISISEFFTKNRHLLGFDNPSKALLTTVKEAVDNALDACEDAGILPTLWVAIDSLENDRFRISIEDNGPGIVKKQIPKIFGKLLYGSKFHTLRQQRGQQGIGISAAAMYGQITTGQPVSITSRIDAEMPAQYYQIRINTQKNSPEVVNQKEVDWWSPHGTKVEIELVGSYKQGHHSVDAYLEHTAISNPHARITYSPPKGDSIVYQRIAEELPPRAAEIKPHPYGVELGLLMKMLQDTKGKSLIKFLTNDFSRVSFRIAQMICEEAELRPEAQPRRLNLDGVERLHRAIPEIKIMAPPTNCLSPMGEERILEGLKRMPADFYCAVSRGPSVYRGNPFQVEAGLAYGCADMTSDDSFKLLRYANRVPLHYQQGACAITKSVTSTGWRNYGLTHPRGGLPLGSGVVLVHIASAWVPFTSESKESVAHYPEILKEIRLALNVLGRQLQRHLSRRRKAREADRKLFYIQKYLPHIGAALTEILDLQPEQQEEIVETLSGTLNRSRR